MVLSTVPLSFFLSLTFSDSTSQVKYREKYINSLGTWKSIPDRPEFFFSRIVNDNVSSVSAFCKLQWEMFMFVH